MNNVLTIFLISILIVIFILLIVVLVKLSFSNKEANEIDFSNMTNSFNQNLLNLSNHINDTINSLKDNTNDKLASLNSSITRVDEAQNSLKSLSSNIDYLSRIFTDKKTRGNYGETELYTILTSLYGDPGIFWAKQHNIDHQGNRVIADAALFGFKNGEIICIDSKFPMENYLRMNDEKLDDQEKNKATTEFKNNVKKHIDAISGKYIIDGITANCAFMFLPSEAIFTQIYNNFNDLVAYSYDKHVYLASPTTLVAYISAIKNIYLEFVKEQNANKILLALQDLAVEFARFDKRNRELYDDLVTFAKKFKDVNITTEKIVKRFNRLNNVENKEDSQEEIEEENNNEE